MTLGTEVGVGVGGVKLGVSGVGVAEEGVDVGVKFAAGVGEGFGVGVGVTLSTGVTFQSQVCRADKPVSVFVATAETFQIPATALVFV